MPKVVNDQFGQEGFASYLRKFGRIISLANCSSQMWVKKNIIPNYEKLLEEGEI